MRLQRLLAAFESDCAGPFALADRSRFLIRETIVSLSF
jgi:hypothetical protein